MDSNNINPEIQYDIRLIREELNNLRREILIMSLAGQAGPKKTYGFFTTKFLYPAFLLLFGLILGTGITFVGLKAGLISNNNRADAATAYSPNNQPVTSQEVLGLSTQAPEASAETAIEPRGPEVLAATKLQSPQDNFAVLASSNFVEMLKQTVDSKLQDFLNAGALTGPAGQQGPKGDKGDSAPVNNGVAIASSNAPVVTYIPPSNTFSGGSVAGFSQLSSDSFSSKDIASGNLNVSGTANFIGPTRLATTTVTNLTVQNNLSLPGTANGLMFLNSQGNIASAPGLFWNDTSGLLGIGNVSPSQALTVAGKIQIGDDTATATAGTLRWNGSNFQGYDGLTWKQLDVQSPIVTPGGWQQDASSGIISLLNATNNVGIGTSTPADKLTVGGNFSATGSANIGGNLNAGASTLTGLTLNGPFNLSNLPSGILSTDASGTVFSQILDLATNFFSGILPISKGGSGASDAAGARANLGLTDTATFASSTWLQTNNNLADIPDTAQARANLDVPSAVGLGASGLWNINILGNAASASAIDWNNVTNKPINLVLNDGNSYNITVATSSFASNALTAQTAATSTYATSAGLATDSNHAALADNASTSTYASQAGHSVLADNAATVNNGVYTNSSYTDPDWLNLTPQKLGLGNVENTALSSWTGSNNITNLGTINSGIWQGTAINDSYISSAPNWNSAFFQIGQWNGQAIGLNATSGRISLGLGNLATLNSVDNSNWGGNALAVSNGGTGLQAIGAAGSLPYSNGSAYDFTDAGSPGQVLLSQGASAPLFTDLGSVILANGNLSVSGTTTATVSITDNPNFTTVNGLSLAVTAQGLSLSGNSTTPTALNLIGSNLLQNASINGNNFNLNLLGNVRLDQDLTTTSTPTFSGLTLNGGATINNDLTVTGSSTLADALVGGNFTAQGTANFNNTVNVTNTTTLADLNVNGAINTASGAYLSAGGTWTNASSRDLKENFTPVDPEDVLQKIDSLAITRWNYKTESADITHIGPMAQDFYAAFNTGGPKGNISISTIDPAGVALVGIQALSQKLNDLTSGLANILQNLGVTIENGIVTAKEFIADKITAKTVVTNGLEMQDTATGQTYCVQITNGDFAKNPGPCGSAAQNQTQPAPDSQSQSPASNSNTSQTSDTNSSAQQPDNAASSTPDSSQTTINPTDASDTESTTDQSAASPAPADSGSSTQQAQTPPPSN